MTDSAAISVCSVSKSFGAVKALDSVDLEVAEGQIFGLVGPACTAFSTSRCQELVVVAETPRYQVE